MTEIGLFPLNVVLLPTERIPLHIFEPRYKELIGECIAEERPFGLVLADDDGVREVGTLALVTQVLETLEDGRMNIVVEGGGRFRVTSLTTGRAFTTARIEAVDDSITGVDQGEAERALGLLRSVGELAGADVSEIELETEQPSFELAAHVEFDVEVKQRLLELRSEPERLRVVADLLERGADGLKLKQEIGERAATNGKVVPPPQA